MSPRENKSNTFFVLQSSFVHAVELKSSSVVRVPSSPPQATRPQRPHTATRSRFPTKRHTKPLLHMDKVYISCVDVLDALFEMRSSWHHVSSQGPLDLIFATKVSLDDGWIGTSLYFRDQLIQFPTWSKTLPILRKTIYPRHTLRKRRRSKHVRRVQERRPE